MPVPAAESIVSDIGHGAFGGRYGLRRFSEMLGQTCGQRQLWIELRPQKLLTPANWQGPVSNAYAYTIAETWDGRILDIVGVKTDTETLTRVESLARCQAAAGRFYYNDATLYVRLTGDVDPDTLNVVAQFGVFVGSHGVAQPTLGPSRITNGTFEAWTGAVPDGWSHSESAGITLGKESTIVYEGTYSAKETFAAAANGATGELSQTFSDLAVGQAYRFSLAYRVSAAITVRLYAWDTVGVYVLSDGRSTGNAAAFDFLPPERDEWRRLTFDFVAATATTRFVIWARNVTGAALTGVAYFDDVKLQPIHRFEYQQPLVSFGGFPTIESRRSDAFYGPVSVGIGDIALANGNGYLESLLAAYDWIGAEVILRVGGRFPGGANEVLMEDCPIVETARVAGLTVTDREVRLRLDNERTIYRESLPRRRYDEATYANLAQQDKGRCRPIVFGVVTGMRPARRSLTADGYGVYEIADVADAPGAGIKTIDYIYAYESEEAATARDSTRRIILSASSGELTADLTNGIFTIDRDVKPIRVTYENNRVDFDIGGGALVSELLPGLYHVELVPEFGDPASIAGYLAGRMNADAGTADITVTYGESTHKFTIAKGAGTLNLLCATGANKHRAMWKVLGFNPNTDRTGALTYTADATTFGSVDEHIIRCDATAYRDDTSGTYTGTASATIQLAPDIVRALLHCWMKVPLAQIDTASFVAARAVCTQNLAVYLGAERSIAELFEAIEASVHADITLEGGVWYFRPRDTSTPADIVDAYDYDILPGFEGDYDPEDYYEIVVVGYSPDPVTGEPKVEQKTTSSVGARWNRHKQRTWQTYLSLAANVTARRDAIATLASTKRRRYRLLVKGKALQLVPGKKLRITRSAGLGTTAPSALLVRVLGARHDWAAWASDLDVVEVV